MLFSGIVAPVSRPAVVRASTPASAPGMNKDHAVRELVLAQNAVYLCISKCQSSLRELMKSWFEY
jgi:hypothetical protein